MGPLDATERLRQLKKAGIAAEFRAFVLRGNIVDLAVGIIIGAAFGTVVQSLVNDVMMPPIGLLLGGVDFSQSYLLLKDGTPIGPYVSLDAAIAAGAVTLRYGQFINAVISFVIVAFAVFLLLKSLAKLKAKEQAAAPKEQPCPLCLMAIPIGATRCGHCAADLATRAR